MPELAYSLVVGLGNPGAEYADTRHNAGFKVVDTLADELGVRYWKSAGGAMLGEGRLDGETVYVAKPLSFMNLSGGPVKALCESLELDPADVLVVHDDLDLPENDIRFKRNGGHGGHNGLRSITEKLGTNEYARLRIGIGRPPGRMDAADYVLQVLKRDALEDFEITVKQAAEAAVFALRQGIDAAMRQYN